jgi:hypothetical protein
MTGAVSGRALQTLAGHPLYRQPCLLCQAVRERNAIWGQAPYELAPTFE